MHQRKQNQTYRPVRQEQLRQKQRQAAAQEDGQFAGAYDDAGEALHGALERQARIVTENQKPQSQ